MKLALVATLLAASHTAFAADNFANPQVGPQSAEGRQCLEQLVLAQDHNPGAYIYDFEGPHARNANVVEYWAWNGNVRAPAYIIQLATNDASGWKLSNNTHYVAGSLQSSAKVYEFLRGGDMGPYLFTIDLTPCAAYLKGTSGKFVGSLTKEGKFRDLTRCRRMKTYFFATTNSSLA